MDVKHGTFPFISHCNKTLTQVKIPYYLQICTVSLEMSHGLEIITRNFFAIYMILPNILRLYFKILGCHRPYTLDEHTLCYLKYYISS